MLESWVGVCTRAASDGFETVDIATSGTTIHGVRGGQGPPVLLLHGIPETHLMWHRVAPLLAERFTVVATDLRGFGDSGRPPSASDHAPYSMREIARDQLEVMHTLGYDRFSVAGHDRGARCAYRLALDHERAVSRLAVLDFVPTADAFRRADRGLRPAVLGVVVPRGPEPVPEGLIIQAPAVLVDHMLEAYSSLSYLKRFPFDTLKIVCSFVDGLGQNDQDTAIVQSVVSLAKTLSLSVTAEGIETRAQEAHLRLLGCERGQGFLFARPVAAEALAELLAAAAVGSDHAASAPRAA